MKSFASQTIDNRCYFPSVLHASALYKIHTRRVPNVNVHIDQFVLILPIKHSNEVSNYRTELSGS